MIAVVDACTVLNLLQADLEEKYIIYIQRLFEQVVIHPKVFEEIQKNRGKNLQDGSAVLILDNLINSYIRQLIAHADDIEECCIFLKRATEYPKMNGEFYSIALSLYLSRIGEHDVNENLLKTCFISDDDIAKKDFEHFFKENQIGQFLDSIDIVTLCYLKEYISKKEILDYCSDLKTLYNREAIPLIEEIERIQKHEKDSRVQHVLSISLERIQHGDTDELDGLQRDKNFIKLRRKEQKFAELFDAFLQSNIGIKIEYIQQRQKDIERNNVWKI